MTHVQQTASVHPHTITDMSENPDQYGPPRRRRNQYGPARNGEVSTTKYHDALLAHAHSVVGDEKGRIEFLPDGGIHIHNSSDWKRKRRG